MSPIKKSYLNKILRNSSGFTLLELSMVMIISGIIISILVGIVPLIFTSNKVNDTRIIINTMDSALQGYLSVKKHLPCPDTDGDGHENRNDNGTTDYLADDSCPSYEGNLPFITLGIPSDNDVWKNRLYYAIYEDLISSDTCADLKFYIEAAATTHSEDPGETEKLYVTSRSATLNPSVNMAYVIISGGLKDLDSSGTRFDGFNSSDPSYQFECEERFSDESYDDIVKAKSLSYLYGKHCTGNQW